MRSFNRKTAGIGMRSAQTAINAVMQSCSQVNPLRVGAGREGGLEKLEAQSFSRNRPPP